MYSGRVLIGFWFDKLALESEKREQLLEKRAKGELPNQRKYRLIRAFDRLVSLPPLSPSSPSGCNFLKLNQMIQLRAPEIPDLSWQFDGSLACSDDGAPIKPTKFGLVLAATAGIQDLEDGIENIVDGCALACTPRREPATRNVFVIRAPDACKDAKEDYLRFGKEFVLQLANAREPLFLRSETPLVDGQFGPNDHNPLRLNVTLDCYAKWRAVHWNKHERFETEGAPIPPCMRIVIQHVMTGKCLAVESLNWHRSLLGIECGVSVHTYANVHRNETSECIWIMTVGEKVDERNN